MRTLTMIAVAAVVALPAIAQQDTVHDPFRRPSIAEGRIDRAFAREQDRMEQRRAETREDVRRGRDDRDPSRNAFPRREQDGRERRP